MSEDENFDESDLMLDVRQVLDDVIDAIDVCREDNRLLVPKSSPSFSSGTRSDFQNRSSQHSRSHSNKRPLISGVPNSYHHNYGSNSHSKRRRGHNGYFSGSNNNDGLLGASPYASSTAPHMLFAHAQQLKRNSNFSSRGIDSFFRGGGFWRKGDSGGTGGVEVVPSLSSAAAASQLITPTSLMGQQKDTTWTKLFVGGLPYHTTDKSLRDHFKVYGDIEEAVVITDRQTGKSRGYGFVSYKIFKSFFEMGN